MLMNHLLTFGRAAAAALLTVSLAASALAQTGTRISRTESDFDSLNRRLPAGQIGGIDDSSRSRSILSNGQAVDLSQVNRTALTNLMRDAHDESGRLYTSLEADARRNSQLRPMLTDLRQLRQLSGYLNQDLSSNVALDRILSDFQKLDADWRLFAHRMTSIRGLSATTTQSVERINNIDQQIGKLFRVEPTIDRRELLRQLAVLDSALFNLAGELEREVSSGTSAQQLASNARKLRAQVQRSQDTVYDGATYDEIVTEHSRFERSWEVLMGQLASFNSRYIRSAVRQIVEADNLLHELLWIEDRSDRSQLKLTADALMRDVDEFYSRTPLKLLLSFGDDSRPLRIADDFYGTIKSFQDTLNEQASDQQLIDSYGYIEDFGSQFLRTFSRIRSQQGIVVLKEIEDGIAALRSELHLGGTVSQVDTRRLLPVAAQLENLADQLNYDVRQWLNTARPPERAQIQAASTAFMNRTSSLHRLMSTEPRLQDLQREFDALATDWEAIYNQLDKCRTAERSSLSAIAMDVRYEMSQLYSALRQ